MQWQGEELADSNANESPSWAYARGVVQLNSSSTLLCFSRRLLAPAAKASADLRAASAGGVLRRRRRRQLVDGGSGVSFNWAISPLDRWA